MSPEEIIALLGLEPHPEGGHYRETWRDPGQSGRGAGTAIYHFLRRGEFSHWHRVDSTEVWHFYAGDPIRLSMALAGTERIDEYTLGPDIGRGERPQIIVPPHAWQAAVSLGDWTLVGCTVSPAFEFSGFELAPAKWSPGSPRS